MPLRGTAAGAAVLPFLKVLPAHANGEVLVVASGQTVNGLDLHRTGTNRASYQVAVNCYDRLVTFRHQGGAGRGGLSYDYSTLEPELAESWEVSEDGLTVTFRLKSDATLWDGRKVTAADEKWSFDRRRLGPRVSDDADGGRGLRRPGAVRGG